MRIKFGRFEKELLLCLVFSTIVVIMNSFVDIIILDLTSLICLGIVLLLLYSNVPDLIIKYLSFVITSTWSVIAVYLLENRIGITVGNMVSQHSGALPPYVWAWILFYFMIAICEKNSHSTTTVIRQDRIKSIPNYLTYAALGLSILCFALVIRNPSFVLGENRFGYRDSVQSGISRNLYKYVVPMTPIMVFNRKKYTKECIGFIISLLLYNLWIGEKYGGFFQILILSVLGFFQTGYSSKLKRYFKRVIVIAGIFLLSLLIVVFFQRNAVNPNEDYFSYLSERISSQGLTWWATYKGDKNNGWHIDEIGDEISAIIRDPEGDWNDFNHGIYKQMKLFQNPAKVRSMLRARVRAAESTRATFFYYLKYLGIIICQVGGAYIAYRMIRGVLKAINRGDFLLSYFYVLLFRYYYQAFEQSDFYLMATGTAIISYLAIFFLKHTAIRK